MIDETDPDALFAKLKELWLRDEEHTSTWRKEAKEDFDFVANRQWAPEDEEKLKAQGRPPIVFNRAAVIIDSICGDEIKNRQEIRFIPRRMGVAKKNELYTAAGDYFRDQCEASNEETAAFRDRVICGMGWTEERIDFEENQDGDYVKTKVDPLEMYWDCSARKGNLMDARRVWRARQMPVSEAMSMFPGYEVEELHAGWAGVDEVKNDASSQSARAYEGGSNRDARGSGEDREYVTIVHAQWYDREHFVRYVDPLTGQESQMPVPDFDKLAKRIVSEGGTVPKRAVQTRKVRKQCWIGSKILGEVEPTACPTHFAYQAITGTLDHNKGTWYGIVRVLKDPQRYANKWLSQSLHILNTSATGGWFAERGAFENDQDAEKDIARTDKMVWMNDGALSGDKPRVIPKTQPANHTGHYQMMEFAIQSVRDVSGINLEQLGLRQVDQPASLEYQRRQAAMTILQPMFDGLRRYRKSSGEILLYFVSHNLSDGRLIRIVGEEQAEYIPLTQDESSDKYDVIVDEVPTSPNQKEFTWGIMRDLLPMLQPFITPKLAMKLIKYTPLPETAVEDITKTAQEELEAAANGPPDPKMLEVQGKLELEKADAQNRQQQSQIDAQIEMAKLQFEERKMALEERMAILDHQLKEREMLLKADLEREKAGLQLEQAERQAQIQAHLADKDSERRAKAAEKPAATVNLDAGSAAAMITDELRSARTGSDEKMMHMMEVMHSAIKELGRPRKTTILRDPKTNRAIGAEHH